MGDAPLPRRLLPLALLLLAAGPARGQWSEVVIDPALGNRPTFGPGGYLSNGFGYGAYGPRGYGYYPGLYVPPNDMHNGPGPAYSPLYSALAAAPPPDARSDRASWAVRPSLPFTGRSAVREFLGRRHR